MTVKATYQQGLPDWGNASPTTIGVDRYLQQAYFTRTKVGLEGDNYNDPRLKCCRREETDELRRIISDAGKRFGVSPEHRDKSMRDVMARASEKATAKLNELIPWTGPSDVIYYSEANLEKLKEAVACGVDYVRLRSANLTSDLEFWPPDPQLGLF